MDRIPSITRQTQVEVRTGIHLRRHAVPVPPDPPVHTPVVYNLTPSAVSTLDNGESVKLQVYGSALSIKSQRVPFEIREPVTGEPAVRGVDFNLVDGDGVEIPGDYFHVPAGALRGDVWVEPLIDLTSAENKVFLVRLIHSNSEAKLPGDRSIGFHRETVVTIEDNSIPSVPKMAFVESSVTVLEPDGTDITQVEIRVAIDRVSASIVTADVQPIDGIAVNPTDYTLPSTTVTIPALEKEAVFIVNVIGNNTYQGDRDVRFQLANIVNAEGLDGGQGFLLTIEDNEVEVFWDVIWDPQHGGAITVDEGSTVNARLVFNEGVSNSEPVLVTWEFEDSGGTGLVLGGHITTSAANPVTIPPNIPFVDIPLTGVITPAAYEDRDFKLNIIGVTGGGAEVGDGTTLNGTLKDTTVILPSIRWQDDSITLVEGSTGWGALILSEAQANPITVTIQRTGSAGPSDLIYEGESGPLVIPVGDTSLPVSFTALQDTILDPGETAIFTILADTGYTVGAIATFTVSISEPSTGTSTVEFRPTPFMETLVSVCTGFDPHPVNSPPKRKIGGVRCDVFPIDEGRRGSDPVAWECVAFVEGPTGLLPMEEDDGTAPLAAGYTTLDISSLTFWLQTVTEGSTVGDEPHAVTMADALLVETVKDGHYIQDTTWLLRPKHPTETGKHEYCGQIMLWVTRRPDCIRVRAELLNEGYDPTNAAGHYGVEAERVEVDGTILFASLRCDMVTPGALVKIDEDSTACSWGSYPIRVSELYSGNNGLGGTTTGYPPHILPPLRSFCWDFTIYEAGTLTAPQVEYIGRDSGHGAVIDGTDAYYLRPWYSPNAAFLPEPTSGYKHPSGATGFAAVKAWGDDYLNTARAVIHGTSSQGVRWFTTAELGGNSRSWFNPARLAYSRASGGGGIMMQRGFDFHFNAMRALWLESKHTVQAEPSGVMDITTGLPLTGTVAMATNYSYSVTKNPMYGSPNNTHHGWEWHWFTPIAAIGAHADDCKRPDDRAWSQFPDWNSNTDVKTLLAEPLSIQTRAKDVVDPSLTTIGVGSDLYSYGACDVEHHVRAHSIFIALAWQRNSSWARFHLRKHAARIERIYSYIPVEGLASAGEGYSISNQDLTLADTRLGQTHSTVNVPSTNSYNYGGFFTKNLHTEGGTFGMYRSRGEGHACSVQAAAGAVTRPDAPDYDDRLHWWNAWLNASRKGATVYGAYERASVKDRQGVTRTNPDNDNHPSWGSLWLPSSYIPLTATAGQWWKTAWYACRHFSGNKVYGDSASYGVNIRQFCDIQAFSMFRVTPQGSRVSGQARPMKFIIPTLGSWGQEDISGPVPVSHNVRYPDGSPVLADTRIMPIVTESLRGLDELGLSSEYDELIGYLKEFFYIGQSQTISAVIAELQYEMSRSFSGGSRWSAGYVSDLLGFLQHKER